MIQQNWGVEARLGRGKGGRGEQREEEREAGGTMNQSAGFLQ